jgi:hypothetical protein
MIKLSEIILTDCYIDCGSNEKLREVYPLIEMEEYTVQKEMGVAKLDILILISNTFQLKATCSKKMETIDFTIHHISQIDLTQ